MATRKRRSISDDELAQIAIERFTPEGDRPYTSHATLAARFGRDQTVISRAVTEAFRRGIVEVRRAAHIHFERLDALEVELMAAFPDKLKTVRVVDLDVEPGSDSVDPAADDRLHEVLGCAMADLIDGLTFRSGDQVGVGGGRGVYHCARSLSQRGKVLRESGITLVSLTGAMYAKHHSNESPSPFVDADDNINVFMNTFVKARVHPASYPLWHGDDARGRSWKDVTLTHALVGVGVMTPGHRLFEEYRMRETGAPGDPLLDDVYPDIKGLAEHCAQALERTSGRFCPVGDLCNRLFFIDPPAEFVGKTPTRKQAQSHMDRVNRRSLVFPEDRFREIGEVMVVAGSRIKARAIFGLLQQPYRISVLCTDRGTATDLLRWHRDEEVR